MHISTVLQNVYDQISQAAVSDNKIPGLPTGLTDLDETILGLNRGELILIASRPVWAKPALP